MTRIIRYRCLACMEAFGDFEEAEYHCESMTDSRHESFRSKFGVPQMVQMIEVDDLTEVQLNLEECSGKKEVEVYPDVKPSHNEWTDYLKPYPFAPYYRYGHGNEKGPYRYYCSDHDFDTPDPKEFFKHLTETESDKQELQNWLLNHIKTSILNRIRHEKGSSQLLTDEDLNRMAETELKEMMMNLELTMPQPERMKSVVSEEHKVLSKFLQGKADHCPLCHRVPTIENTEQFRAKKILEGLKSGMQNLSGKETFDQLVKRKYEGTWNEQPIGLCLECNLHLHLRHPQTYSGLVNNGILKGGLPQWLTSESYMYNKPFEEMLSKGLEAGKDKNLSEGQKCFKKWLEGKKQ